MVERMPPRGTNATQGRTSLRWAALACISISGLSGELVCAAANLDRTVDFHIPAQPLDTALLEFSKQAQIQVMVNSGSLRKMTAPNVTGQMAASDALSELLEHSGLQYGMVGNTVTVAPHALNSDAAEPMSAAEAQSANPPPEPRRSLPSTGAAASSGQQASSGGRDPGQMDEVLVSAEKRTERLQDVPVPVTAIGADTLIESNQLRIQDYYASVPGLNVVPQASSSYQTLSIRGITTSVASNPTVGVTVDDVPYGSSTYLGGGGGAVIPDIDPADLARVEVLRGPQGTLYGASSMGGLLKFVTVDPSTSSFSGRVQADVNSVYNGANPGYSARGSVNVPLSDTLAVRASAFTRRDPGYIDNPVLHVDGINEQRVSGGRLSALWKPSDAFTVKLSALYQDTKGNGVSDVDQATAGYTLPALGDLQQSYLRGTGAYDRRVQAYSATLKGELGDIDVTAVSGYNINSFSDSYDVTYVYAPYTQDGFPGIGFDGFGVPGTALFENDKTTKFTQELRLSASIGQSFDWLVGGFYTHENSAYSDHFLAENPDSGVVVGEALNTSFSPTYSEYAAFADLTYHVTNRFDIQIGGRESRIKETYQANNIGLFDPIFFGLPSPIIGPRVSSNADAFTYLLTPRFKITPELMVYARLASGYRPGASNYSVGTGAPAQYNPDKTQNYEMGVKGDFFGRLLSVDASLYYIDWKDIQISLVDPTSGISFIGNGSRAKSQGLELSVVLRPLTGMTLATWVAWDEAVLTRAFPSTSSAYGAEGDRLPYSSRFSGNISLQQDFPLSSQLTGFVGGTVSYVGDRESEFAQVFTGSTQRQNLPAYAKADLRAGARYESWTVNLFINNVADRRGLLSGGLGSYPPFAFQYIQPRTVGLSVAKTF